MRNLRSWVSLKVYKPGSVPISNGKKTEKPKYTIVELPEKAKHENGPGSGEKRRGL